MDGQAGKKQRDDNCDDMEARCLKANDHHHNQGNHTLGVGLLTERFNPLSHGILRFCTNGFVVVAVFLVSIILFGLNQYEKKTFLGFLGKFKRN
jgi:hypothetical protein